MFALNLLSLPAAIHKDEQLLVDAILRYQYYIELGIQEDKHLSPFDETWAANALSLIPPSPPRGVSRQYYDSLLLFSMEEIHHEYNKAMKKSIVDYVLSNPMERKRMDLEILQPLISTPGPTEESRRAVVTRVLPPSWRQDVEAAREEVAWTLQTLSANALELSSLWHQGNFVSSKLVDVEAPSFVSQLPMMVRGPSPTPLLILSPRTV